MSVAAITAACALAASVSASARPATPAAPIHLAPFAHFNFPTEIATTPADPYAVYVAERSGRVYIVRFGRKIRHPFLDIHKSIAIGPNSEQGLVGMTFSPNYGKNGLFYVYYTNRQGNIRLKQFRRDPHNHNRALPRSGRTILAISHPRYPNHYGGHIAFGPDGDLYIGTGDGGGVGDPNNNAQNLDSMLGKILRIRPLASGRRTYLIPRDNPFVHDRNTKHEVFAYGLRNPFKWSFDYKTGAVWIADVGENSFEEVDYRRSTHRLAGTNFGWSRYEGYSLYNPGVSAPGAVFPILVEAHSGGTSGSHETWCAIIGGYVVRDPRLKSLDGKYLFADHCKGGIYGTRVSRKGHAYATGYIGLTVPALVTTFGVDPQKRIYVAGENGWVYRLAP